MAAVAGVEAMVIAASTWWYAVIRMPRPMLPDVEAEVRRRWRRTSVWLVMAWLMMAWLVLPNRACGAGLWMLVVELRAGTLDPGDVGMTVVASWARRGLLDAERVARSAGGRSRPRRWAQR